MKKKLFMLAATGMMTVAMTMTAFAGQWKQETAGWWYDNEDGTYPSNGWTWVDGKCYYFTPEGYCLMNTQTPDGYTVDASGAWVIDGVVQTQAQQVPDQPAGQQQAAASVQFVNMTFTAPDGFSLTESNGDEAYFMNGDNTVAIGMNAEAMDGAEENQELLDIVGEYLLDTSLESEFGTPDLKATKQFPTGTWYYYGYENSDKTGIPGSTHLYARFSNGKLIAFFCGGAITTAEADSIMTNNLK